MWRSSLIICLFVLCLSVDYVQPAKGAHRGWNQLGDDFDLLIFTQNWPITVCREWKKYNSKHTCTMPKEKDIWTIHGVWPTKLHTVGPSFCNRSWHFDPEQVRPIEVNLTRLWTNIEAVPLNYSFWSHEWTKHGTCAAVLEPLNSEFKYFSKGLEWLEDYTMTKLLSPQVMPDNNKLYSVLEIHNAVRDKVKVNPAIECREMDDKSWLVEIRLCFDKTLHLTDCDGIVGTEHYKFTHDDSSNVITNCNLKKDVFYPKDLIPPNKLIVELYKLTSWLEWITL